jgi:Tol biopolymer transport system component
MSAILKEDPPDLSVTNQNVSPGLERIVRHCLEKNPEQRFHSAHDLAFDLEALSTASSTPAGLKPVAGKRSPVSRPALLVAAALALAALAYWAGRRTPAASATAPGAPPAHQRITFRRGNVLFARFTADGQTVVYSAAWGDRPAEVFLTRIGSPESRPLGIENANLLSVSPTGELAILLKKGNVFGVVGEGTLARVPLGGGTPRQIEEDVASADWLPDGSNLAAVRRVEGKTVLEFPLGKRVYAPGIEVSFPRVAPDGRSVALIEGSNIVTIDASGKRTALVPQGFIYIDSIAWHPSGREIWFAANDSSGRTGMYAVDMAGRIRLVAATTDMECLHDIARDGAVLVEREISTREIQFASAADAKERDLSWLDQSNLATLSPDGKAVLLSESGQGGGLRGAVYLRSTDGSPALRLGEGFAFDLSPDGKWALTVPISQDRVVLLPTGAGQPQEIRVGNLRVFGGGFVPPDGRRIAFGAVEPGHGPRLWVVDAAGKKPRPVTPEGLTGAGGAVSPDGKFFAANGPDGRVTLYPVDGGDPRPIEGVSLPDSPVQWSAEGQYLYLARFGEVPLPIARFELATKKREAWKQLAPADRAGLVRIESIALTRDGKSYAYSYNRVTDSDLFVVTGWR